MYYPSNPQRRISLRGFTLIELIIVMTIIAILMAFAINGMQFANKNAAKKKTTAQMEAIKLALTRYHNDYGSYPTSDDFTNISWDSPDKAGSQILYQVLSGDFNGDGDVDDPGEEPMFEAISSGTESKFGLVAEDSTGKLFLADGFGAPINYRCPADANVTPTDCFNQYTYDMWSYSDDEEVTPTTPPTPGSPSAPGGVPEKWLTNW